MYSRDLLTFLTALGVDRTALSPDDREVETLDRYTLLLLRPTAAVNNLTPALCQPLVSTFGSALSLSVGDSNAPALEIRQGEPPTDLPPAIRRAQQFPVAELRLDIDKRIIARHLLASDNNVLGKYFIFGEYLIRFLNSPLPDLDHQLFIEDRPVVIVVGDANIHYAGQLLTIVGETQLGNTPLRIAPLRRQLQVRLDRYRHTATEQLNWVGFRLQRLTPLHFLYKRHGTDNVVLTTTLTRHLLHIGILYSANRTSKNDIGYEALYASPDRTITLNLRAGDVLAGDQCTLIRFVLWPYDGLCP